MTLRGDGARLAVNGSAGGEHRKRTWVWLKVYPPGTRRARGVLPRSALRWSTGRGPGEVRGEGVVTLGQPSRTHRELARPCASSGVACSVSETRDVERKVKLLEADFRRLMFVDQGGL